MSWSEHVIIITGAAQGQGLAHARALAERGATVIATDFDSERGQREVDQIAASGGSIVFRELDVSKADQWEELATWADETYGKVTGLVNNAGISMPGNVLETTEEVWNTVLGVNQLGPFLGMRTMAPLIARSGGGSIVNTASTLGKFASPASFAYQATKGAVRMMTKSAALALAPHKIRVNTVLPGLVDTEFIARHKETGALDSSLSRIALGRIGEPQEISAAVVFLLSDEASYVTGAEIIVDGGLIAGSTGSLLPRQDS
ncbi:MAG: SDR family oxidoreductase [Bowdeniella nasicola]|nr:SDR family oxidoreductase [Bowdeniella nasicola]